MKVSEETIKKVFLATVETFKDAEGDDRVAQSQMLLQTLAAYPFLSATIPPETLRAIEDADGSDKDDTKEIFHNGLKQFKLAEGDSRAWWARMILMSIRCYPYPYLSREIDADMKEMLRASAEAKTSESFDDFRANWKDKP